MTERSQDENTPIEDPESEDQTTPVEPTPTENEGDESPPEPTGFDALPEETKREIRSLRKSGSKLRKQLNDLQDTHRADLESRDTALAEAQRQAADATERYRTAMAKANVLEAAPKANAISGNAVYACIKDSIEYDDDGTPTNVADLIEKLKSDDPDLFRKTSIDGGRGTPTATTSMNDRIRRAAGRSN